MKLFSRARVRRTFVAAAVAVLSFSASVPAHAGAELDRILESAVGRFVMTQTSVGSEIAIQALGQKLRGADTLEALSVRLARPEMETVSQRLEQRLRLVEDRFYKEYPQAKGELTIHETAYLRALAQNQLYVEAEAFPAVAGQASRFEAGKRAFLSAVPGSSDFMPRVRYPFGANPAIHPERHLKFGFESEYTFKDLDKLLSVYGPTPEFGISSEKWLAMPSTERVTWVKTHVKALFPDLRQAGKLVKLSSDPTLSFLPKNLIQDATGNLEIIVQPLNTFEEWQRNVYLLNEQLGTGSMQGTVGAYVDEFFGKNAQGKATLVTENIGFFNFNNEFDTLTKLEVGATRYAEDPTRPAANSFNHSFLGPLSRMKQLKLIQFIQANARGEMLDAAVLRTVSAQDNSFKYVGGTAYRPDIAKNWVVLEVRDAHTSMDALVDRMSRAVLYLQEGRSEFAGAAKLPAFDSQADFAKLPDNVQEMLKGLFPARFLPDTEYSAEEKLAIEVFRNFSYPMRDWTPHLNFLGEMGIKNQVVLAQRAYSSRLQTVAQELAAGTITRETAALKAQGALVQFSTESRLTDAFRKWGKGAMERTLQNGTTSHGTLHHTDHHSDLAG